MTQHRARFSYAGFAFIGRSSLLLRVEGLIDARAPIPEARA